MPFYLSLAITTQDGKNHTVAARFKSDAGAELLETDQYDECREKIQQWLDRHYPGERLNDDGDDIESDGGVAEFPDDVLDFTAN